MNRFVWSRVCMAAMAVAAAVGPNLALAEEDSLSLKIANALRPDKFFVRGNVIYANIKTKSGDTKDITGPVVTLDELKNVFVNSASVYTDPKLRSPVILQESNPDPDFPFTDQENLDYLFDRTPGPANLDQQYGVGILMNAKFGLPIVTRYMEDAGIDGIGTPAGIRGKAKNSGTAGISLGYYLDDEYKWLVETFVLAAPLRASVVIQGTTTRINEFQGSGSVTRPLAIVGPTAISSKLVPPTVFFGRYWGDKNQKFRPYTGVMGMYAIFADTKATDVLNSYVGGTSPGDTTVSIKNTFGMGPVIGFKYQATDSWHASMNVGSVRLKTQATLTTRNTNIGSSSLIVKDLGVISDRVLEGETAYTSGCSQSWPVACDIVKQNGGLVSLIMKGIIADRYKNGTGTGDGQSLGTYVRKTDTILDSTIFMLSVGRSF